MVIQPAMVLSDVVSSFFYELVWFEWVITPATTLFLFRSHNNSHTIRDSSVAISWSTLSFHSFSVRFPLLVNRLFFSLSKAARRLFA